MGIYEEIIKCDLSANNRVDTVIKGDSIGEKALYSRGKLVYETTENGYFSHDVKEDEIYSDIIQKEPHIVVCGAGHIGIALVKLAIMTGYKITVIDDRPSFVARALQLNAHKIICDDFSKALDTIEGGDNIYFVIATRGHRYDQICTNKIAKKDHAYIGLLGSRRRTILVKQAAIDNGAPKEAVNGIYTPIGLDINAQTPEEIAIAIMAQIISIRNNDRHVSGFTEEILNALVSPGKKVLATIIKRSGSAPRAAGTKMVIKDNGEITGTIGGGCMEAEVITNARLLMNDVSCQCKVIHVDMSSAEAEEEAMACGGNIDVLMEVVADA